MTAELVRHQTIPASLPDKMQYAKVLAASGMLPSQYRNQPANLLYALEFADSLGLHPMAAITGVHVIEGKPSASSALISALVRRAGHKLRVTGNDQQATAQIVRADDPEFTFECTWTMDRARQAGLASKKVWQNYPAAMLKARAITEVAREACEEALSGMHYTPEELGANVNEDGLPVEATVQQLHRVQPGETDSWATSVPDPAVVPTEQKLANAALLSSDPQHVRDLYRQAKDGGLLAATVKVDSESIELGAYLIARGKEMAQHAEPVAGPGLADDVVDGEVVTTPEDDYAAAVADLRDAAEAAHLEDFEAGTEAALGMPLANAPTEAIRALAAQIRPAA